ncbi:MAG: NCS2 family permease [Firmicutes bacterium]|jgi:AGZA family xanthine/uracil permease-like MFS transporter|nr:NCS2 family permease [Bacillota bacterium]
MKSFLDETFKLTENGTDVKTEVLAGITTFMTMAYIIFVNPNILSETGMSWGGVFIATVLATALGTLCMAFLTNYPFAMAPGMGLNAFFAFSVCLGMGVPWQVALGIVFIEGVIFIALSILPIREAIVNAIPMGVKSAIGAGIGLFIAFIGLQTAEIVVGDPATLVALGDLSSKTSLLALIGLILTGVLCALEVKGALLLGIFGTTLIGALPFFGVTPPFAGLVAWPSFGEWSKVLFQLDIRGALSWNLFGVMFAFLFVDMFDTVGTLIGVSTQTDFLDEDGKLPKAGRALLSDAIGTVAGALFGTSTVTTYVESAAGVAEGGRTGLTGVVASILFLLSLFFMPLVGIVPAAATAPALIIVGVMMLKSALNVDWNDFTEALPAFVTIAVMPLTYSISNGIALGLILYPLMKLLTGQGNKVHWLVYFLGVLFVIHLLFA